MVLSTPTRAYRGGTALEKGVGFVAASLFSVIYYAAPAYLAVVAIVVWRRDLAHLYLLAPVLVSVLLPSSVLPAAGFALLRSYPFRQIPKYFEYEEYHETTDQDLLDRQKVICCMHPHGVFPFTSVCAAVASMNESDGLKTTFSDFPTAAAAVVGRMPILKDIIGLFGIIDASSAGLRRRLESGPRGSFVLYPGGLVELFHSSPTKEAVFVRKRKGFIKLALTTGAAIVPAYLFGNTTVLSALTSGPLAATSRKLGVSVTVFWGRWGLPLPKPVHLTYARAKLIQLPKIPEPTNEEIAHWHTIYCEALLKLFDDYKATNPSYATKSLVFE